MHRKKKRRGNVTVVLEAVDTTSTHHTPESAHLAGSSAPVPALPAGGPVAGDDAAVVPAMAAAAGAAGAL